MIEVSSTAWKADSGYTAKVGEDDRVRTTVLKRLVRTTEPELNRHLMRGHLPIGYTMATLGYQFDAELAAFLGISLQQTADASMEIVTAIRSGNFGNTALFTSIVGSYHFLKTADSRAADPDAVAARLEADWDYTNRLAAELRTLQGLGVATVDLPDTDLTPIATDSFFDQFRVSRQHDSPIDA